MADDSDMVMVPREAWERFVGRSEQARGFAVIDGHDISLRIFASLVDELTASASPVGECDETWESIAAWQRETFGPVELARQAQRAAEEMDELLADPHDVEEAADVCIVLAGYPGIREAINRKMAKNRSRKWRLNGDGTGYHVKPSSPSPGEGETPVAWTDQANMDRLKRGLGAATVWPTNHGASTPFALYSVRVEP